ncbi:Gfo/Idh/MocA family oxidoreductase [Cellulomonas sp. ATA003]|uniref:Gfo/Idh/MocA family protein n=1 Tax=Cellulomonas sp. ATA003 TaxID=3073064 RepID=UPI002873CA8B|nr:Gfo/Idh/MocA family oxidoreductase [Cellulomonas sp. ATA003]WNB87199.1 Gfo/Idh/MocA family oxidoreductase [Cellulomonas sp. ATA003]
MTGSDRPDRPRIAVVGAGWWSANHHVPSLAQHDGAELVAICDPDRGRAEQLASEHGVPHVTTDLDSLLALCPDGVVIATPHVTHHDLASRALDAGVHVLLEKPMTTSAQTAADLVVHAERAGVHLAIGYTDQYAPTAARVRRAVQSDIGDLVQVMAEFSSGTAGLFARAEADDASRTPGRDGDDPADQHAGTYAADQGGGQAHTQLTHLMGMVCWVTGREVAEVAAFTDHRGLDVDVDDAAALRFTGGGTGVVTSTGMAGAANGERHRVRFLGTCGTVDLDMATGIAEVRHGDGTVATLTPPPHEPDDRTWAPARQFAELVAGRADNPAPPRPAAAAAACIEALLESARTRTFVRVTPLPATDAAPADAPATDAPPQHPTGGDL